MKKNISVYAFMLIASTTFTSCQNEDNSIDDIQAFDEQTWNITINATKNSATTRALEEGSGNKITSYWKSGEVITVCLGKENLGTLTATPLASDNTQATFTGTLSSSKGTKVKVGDELNLYYPTEIFDYTKQDGTIATIGNKYDFAKATVTITGIDNTTNTVTTETADFINQQAIVQFENTSSATPKNMSRLIVWTDDNALCQENDKGYETYAPLVITPASAKTILAVSLRCNGGAKNYSLAYTNGSNIYTYNKNGVNFEAGKSYYVHLKSWTQATGSYYWYIGTDNITAATVPGSGTLATSNTQTGWHQITGTPTEIEVSVSNENEVNWVFAIPVMYGITCVTDAGERLYGYTPQIITTSDGVPYYVLTQDDATRNFDYTIK